VLRSTVDYYVSFGTTVNICALDLSKAFDKMNHHGLFIKVMDRIIPVNLLSLLENWFSSGATCVKWGSVVSRFVELSCGVRQGGVLSPHLFSIYIDSVVKKVSDSKIGCYILRRYVCVFCFMLMNTVSCAFGHSSSATAASV